MRLHEKCFVGDFLGHFKDISPSFVAFNWLFDPKENPKRDFQKTQEQTQNN
jgi:hypothetical protein